MLSKMIEAAAEGAVQVAANEDQPEEKKENESKQESAAAAGSGGATSEAAMLEIASLKKKLAEVQASNERLEQEAKT